jgi:SAM-dependent methyltransferase
MARIAFLLSTLGHYLRLQPRTCPYCGSSASEPLGRKKLLLELRRCRQCQLMWRYPKNAPEVNTTFYQKDYIEGMITEFPDALTLSEWMAHDFVGTDKDLSEKIRIVQSQCPAGRLLDYGCSWGYGVFQFNRAGFDAMGYEISIPRARFGRETLGVRILETRRELTILPDRCFDVIFAHHVLEHLIDPRSAFEDWRRLLRPDGVLLVFVPNAGGESARRLGPRWGPMIGEKHPLAIDANFLYHNFPTHGFMPAFCTSPYPSAKVRLETAPQARTLSGDELLAVVRPHRLRLM